MNIIDLSIIISNDTITYPGDPRVSLKQVASINESGYNVSEICMGTHSGTHVDLPLHCMKDGKDAASAPLELFCGSAVVVDVSCEEGKPFTLDSIETDIVRKGDILIIRTGWEERLNQPEFYKSFPYFSQSAVENIKQLGVKAVGTDIPSVDKPGSNGSIHKMIISSDIMIIEALINLKTLVGERFYFSAVPLKIKSGDGSPVRAYAVRNIANS